MMIAKLKSEIEALEESVDSSIAKEDMYDILVKAYYKAKDVIEMYESTAPVTNISEEELKLVKDDLQSANITIITMTNQIQVLQEQLSHNTEVVASIMSLINSSK
jgi:hypothetical protein